jgi:hypothetical protein
MSDDPMLGYDITVKVRSGPDTTHGFVELGSIRDINPPEDQVDQIDVTVMKSPDRRKQFMSGLTEGGEGTFDLLWRPGGTTAQFAQAWQLAGENWDVRIEYPNGSAEEWPAAYRGFRRTAPIGQVLTGSLTVKMAGAPSYEDEA